jgi:hypothetical protein
MLRMQLRDILGARGKENLGSVLYSQTFMMVDEDQVYINVSLNVPNLQCWMTTLSHYESLPLEINTIKNLECSLLGDRVRADKTTVLYSNMQGILPLKEQLRGVYQDVVLNGKLVFYEQGMIFLDNRYHAVVMPYSLVKTMTIFQGNGWWLEVLFEDEEKVRHLFPHNLTTEPRFYLKVNQ